MFKLRDLIRRESEFLISKVGMATAKFGSVGLILPLEVVDRPRRIRLKQRARSRLKLLIEKRRHCICVFSYGAPEIVVGQM